MCANKGLDSPIASLSGINFWVKHQNVDGMPVVTLPRHSLQLSQYKVAGSEAVTMPLV